ncbi:hypothetical protein Bca52824_015320 [Brassica carinata]|uniref:Uncharacterized protein n=1 Tax=Brassica carinata TaxID=52824 RepID=A0A8X8B5K5_BRACI|nr:hypothetical protein Bca52824_015320 [Brassica carinata]
MAIAMFCGKRHEEASSNKGLQLLLRYHLLILFIFFSPIPDMDSTPYAHTANFVELLNSQQDSMMWSIKKADLDTKERLGKIKLLDNLIAKQGPLGDEEEAHS